MQYNSSKVAILAIVKYLIFPGNSQTEFAASKLFNIPALKNMMNEMETV